MSAENLDRTYDLIDAAAAKIAEAGGHDPGDSYVFDLPESLTAEDDLTLAIQLLRRAQSKWQAWNQADLRALAAEMVHRHGSACADAESFEDDITRVSEAEFPEANELQPEHREEVREMMRRAVIEIDGTRYNDDPTPHPPENPGVPAKAIHEFPRPTEADRSRFVVLPDDAPPYRVPAPAGPPADQPPSDNFLVNPAKATHQLPGRVPAPAESVARTVGIAGLLSNPDAQR
jgi:hypothetical protein